MKENVTKADFEALSATVKALTESLGALKTAFEEASGKFEGFHEAYQGLSEKVSEMRDHQDGMNDTIAGLMTANEELSASSAELTDEVRGALNGYEEPEDGPPEDETDEQRATRVGLLLRVTELEGLVRGRNRSAPVKRNMTDADAVRVLTGDVTALGHKEAGEAVGLTYAQVYSCRMEYTFKHVHKKLRDGGWKNPFTK